MTSGSVEDLRRNQSRPQMDASSPSAPPTAMPAIAPVEMEEEEVTTLELATGFVGTSGIPAFAARAVTSASNAAVLLPPLLFSMLGGSVRGRGGVKGGGVAYLLYELSRFV